MSDMLDVIHYYFDSDLSDLHSAEHAEAKDESRKMLYEMVYNRKYLFARDKPNRTPIFDPEDDVPLDFDPLAEPKKTKSFVPPTPFNPDSPLPFGSALDAPLG